MLVSQQFVNGTSDPKQAGDAIENAAAKVKNFVATLRKNVYSQLIWHIITILAIYMVVLMMQITWRIRLLFGISFFRFLPLKMQARISFVFFTKSK